MTMRWVMLMGMIACGLTRVPALADKPKSPRIPVIVDGPSETLREGETTFPFPTISHSGRWIVANVAPLSSGTTHVCLIDASGKVAPVTISRSSGITSRIEDVVFSHDESRFVFQHGDKGESSIWNIANQQIEVTLKRSGFAFSYDDRLLLGSVEHPVSGSSGSDGRNGIRLCEFALDGKWIRDFGEVAARLPICGGPLTLQGDSHGWIYAPVTGEPTRIRDESGRILARLPAVAWSRINASPALALSPNEKLLAITTFDPKLAPELQLFHLEPIRQTDFSREATPILLTPMASKRVGSNSVRFHPSGRAIAVENAKNGVDLHGLDIRRVLVQFRFDKPRKVEAFAFTPDGKSLITVDKAAICRWDVPDLSGLE